MKCLVIFFAIALSLLLSCKKEEGAASVSISSVSINGSAAPDSTISISAGQYLQLSGKVADSSIPHSVSWSVTPNYFEISDPSDHSIVWRPSLPQEYVLTFTVAGEDGSFQDSRTLRFNVKKGDFRYELWGNDSLNVVLNESKSHSDRVVTEDGRLSFRIRDTVVPNGRSTDKMRIGDIVHYSFEGGKLNGGRIDFMKNYGSNGIQYMNEYAKIKTRLEEYTWKGSDDQWQQSILAQTYKAMPDFWDEGFIYGYVKFQDIYESETSKIISSMERTGSSALIQIRYSPR